MHYYKFVINEWALHTSHLQPAEESVYFRLINHYYDSEKPISAETESVIRRLRLTGCESIVALILQEFFVLQEDGWHNKRCDEEISKYHAKAEVNRKIGKLGGRPKKSESVISDNPPVTLIKNKELRIKNKELISIPDGMDVSVWEDYLKIRKAAKKPLTETALKGLQREADKAKLSLLQAIQICCERSWIGFKAEWITESKAAHHNNSQDWRNNDALMVAKAVELGLSTVGLQRYDIINKIDSHLRSRGL
jgi:uncharacterized protein YdaU (DUF1376 family)